MATIFGEQYLSEPDLFPARPGGEAWGDARLALEIADCRLEIGGLAESMRDEIAERYSGSIPPEGSGGVDVEVHVFAATEEEFRSLDAFGPELGIDLEYSEGSIRIASYRFFGLLDRRPGALSALWLPPPATDGELLMSVENFLRVILAQDVAARGGALLHSAGVATAAGAWLFVGRSGAGKSTLCGLAASRGLEILSDELNVLWHSSGAPVVAPLPFAGDHGGPPRRGERRPLAGLFALRQGAATVRRPLALAAAVAELAAAAPFVNADPFRAPRLLENLESIAALSGMEELTFRLDPAFWDVVEPAAVGERARE